MVCDKETNLLYLADCLPKKYPRFYQLLEKVLTNNGMPFKLLPHTKDVWARDYMPLQVDKDIYVRFVYNPDYLRYSKYWQKTISDADIICRDIDITPEQTNILLDGGNVIKFEDRVIMTDKVYSENPSYEPKQLVKELQELLQVDKIIFVPKDPLDFTGHADGMVRFFDKETVIINDYSNEPSFFRNHFLSSLKEAGLKTIELPYNPSGNIKDSQANGIYINYLQMKDIIIVPTYGMKEDDRVVRQLKELFKDVRIVTIDCNDIANEGGVLNCITWNIMV